MEPNDRRKTAEPVVLVGGRFVGLAEARASARRLHAAGRLAEARGLYDRIVSAAPGDIAARSGRGVVRFQLGDPSGAIADLERALQVEPEDVRLLANLGQILLATGRCEEALRRLEVAARLAPDDAGVHNTLGTAIRATGDLERAAEHYRRAASLDARSADAWLNLAAVEEERDRPGEALRCFEAAARVHPGPEAFALLAATQERAGALEAAEEATRKALELDPEHAGALLTRARIRRRRGDEDGAAQIYRELIRRLARAKDRQGLRWRAGAAQELALVLERKGRHGESWDLFLLANEIQRSANPDLDALAAGFRDQVSRLLRAFADAKFVADLRLAETAPSRPRRSPVFLVGFPRSGTTLLVRALAAHPGTAVFDEKPLLSEVLRRLRSRGLAYPEGLACISPDALADLRETYWGAVQKLRPSLGDGDLVIDKDPLNTVHLGLVRLLFPDARVVFSVRDPRDACLSCFGNIFRLTPALATFGTLEGAAQTFAEVVALWSLYRQQLGFPSHVVRYEDLVADFAAGMEGLLGFLGLPWDDAVLRYDTLAHAPLVRTPSYDQVSQRPHQNAIDRWKPYAPHFAKAMHILAPPMAELGYP